MTTDRLVEAINAHNPQTGIRDVIAAAKRTIELSKIPEVGKLDTITKNEYLADNDCLIRSNGEHCVLAVGWKDGFSSIIVGRNYFRIGKRDERPHPYKDVVDWFDCFKYHSTAARSVLNLLKEFDK